MTGVLRLFLKNEHVVSYCVP